MPRFAANLSLMYAELPFLERFAAAARDGFTAVECQFPYAFEASALAAQLAAHDLQLVLFNAPAGCAEAEHATLMQQLVANLRWAAAQAAQCGRELLIEPINPRDMPGYVLNRQAQAHALLDAVQAPNLKVQMDLYHCQIVEGDLSTKLRQYLPTGRVGHIQIAGVPERHEPDLGELNYPHLFALIDALGWDGWIGCEYRPAGDTSQGLGWLRRMGNAAKVPIA